MPHSYGVFTVTLDLLSALEAFIIGSLYQITEYLSDKAVSLLKCSFTILCALDLEVVSHCENMLMPSILYCT